MMKHSRRNFIRAGLLALLAAPELATLRSGEQFSFSRKGLLGRINLHEYGLERLVRGYFEKIDALPAASQRELTYEEGMALTPMIARTVSQSLGTEVPAQRVSDLRIYKKILGDKTLFPPDMPLELIIPMLEYTSEIEMTRAGFSENGGISMGFTYWGEDDFYNVYGHELTHFAIFENRTKDRLRQSLKSHAVYLGELAANDWHEGLLDYNAGEFIECLSEGLARLVQEESAEALAQATGRQGIRRGAYSYTLNEILSSYIQARRSRGRGMPSWLDSKMKSFKKDELDASADDPHTLGTTLLKLMQFSGYSGAVKTIFDGEIHLVERFLEI